MTTTHEIASKFNLNTHLLSTNSIPSQHDRNIIRNSLSFIDKDTSQSEVDIAHLKKVLEERIIDHIALIQRCTSLAAIVSPLRQLPLEIFGQIFAYPSWDNLPKLLSKSWDTLESLVLTAFGNSRAHTIDLTSATRLIHLSVIRDKSSRVMKYDFLKLPCSGLTHLTVDVAITLNDVVSILSECGNLEEFVLTLATQFIYYQNTPPQAHVHLPNLRKLHLHTRVLNQLVKLIETPVLEDLLLHPLDEPTRFNWTDEGVIEFINASKSRIYTRGTTRM
jgi:hypothetical protein